MQHSPSIVVATFNNNHPFYSVVHREPDGLNTLGTILTRLPCRCLLLKSGLWKRCHNWTGDRPDRIAEQITALGVQALCLQEVSNEGCTRQDHRVCRQNAAHTARDIVEALNRRVEGSPWQLAAFGEFYNSRDADYNNASRRGNAILINTDHLTLVEAELQVYEFERAEAGKQQVRRHPWIDVQINGSNSVVRIASAHITGYAHIPKQLREDPSLAEQVGQRTELGDQELTGLLSRLRGQASDRPVALTVLGMDLNENMKHDELPLQHKRRAGCGREDGERQTLLDDAGFVSCWHNVHPNERPSTVHAAWGGCIDLLAHFGMATLEQLPLPQEACSDHKLTAVRYTLESC